ncbi:MAG: hypothetical protein HOV80_37280 [Polyangiaceae bacterium]|nr:hypothetical protein [Polyangiaceae bacterium]
MSSKLIVASLSVVAACGGEPKGGDKGVDSAASAVAASSVTASAVAAVSNDAPEHRFEPCSGSNDKWVGFPAYAGAAPLCCHTTNGLPHMFITVFASGDSIDKVDTFYEASSGSTKDKKDGHVMLSKETESRPRLFVSAADKAPPGCAPAAADKTLITVSDVPPFSH